MSKENISKIYLILEKIEYIEEIVKNAGSITNALHDLTTYRPAILMHLTFPLLSNSTKLKNLPITRFLSILKLMILKGFTMLEITLPMIMKVSTLPLLSGLSGIFCQSLKGSVQRLLRQNCKIS